MQVSTVEEFLHSMLEGRLCIFDVRSPAEFERGAIPSALSLPLLNNIERQAVGLAYHRLGREEAIKVGLELIGPKLRHFIEHVESNCLPGQCIGVYCWRGGMRSNAIAWLLELYGFDVWTLQGGYKAFRRFAMALFELSWSFIVLSGYTGSGKTKLLSMLRDRGNAVLDLERYANHRGSAFGALGLPPQPTQQNFENILALELWKHRSAEYIWIEDESRQIGALSIPHILWKQMQEAPVVALNTPLDLRIEHLVAQYGVFPFTQLAECLAHIRQRLGAQRFKAATEALAAGNVREVARIALEHYDKSYRHSLAKRSSRTHWLNVESLDEALNAIEEFQVTMSIHNPSYV